jgi:uncharacterized protein YdeI (YjbR/CyaY-like superfamily)
MTVEKTYQNIAVFYPTTQQDWRNWLEKNHAVEKSVWVILYRKNASKPGINYQQSLDEALCFGWIDSKPNKRDAESFYQFFSRRNAKSKWSKVNKMKVADLIEQGWMTAAGQAMIDLAKQTGTWDALNEVDSLVTPPDLTAALQQFELAEKHWNAFPPSAKRGILEWIGNAKLTATRAKRIETTAILAQDNVRANQYIPKK